MDEALASCQQAVSVAPFSAKNNYLLAAIHAKRGETDECMTALKRAQELGFRDVAFLERDPDLATVRQHPEFANLIAEAKKPFERPQPKPASLKLGVALVGVENAVWDESINLVRKQSQTRICSAELHGGAHDAIFPEPSLCLSGAYGSRSRS